MRRLEKPVLIGESRIRQAVYLKRFERTLLDTIKEMLDDIPSVIIWSIEIQRENPGAKISRSLGHEFRDSLLDGLLYVHLRLSLACAFFI
jgi:hypothetical protein